MSQNTHYLAEAFHHSLLTTTRAGFRVNGGSWACALVIAGGLLAFVHVAALALCALGVVVLVIQSQAQSTRLIVALNDALIAHDNEEQARALSVSEDVARVRDILRGGNGL